MKVKLRDIPSEGLTVEQTVSAEDFGFAKEDFVCLTPLAITAQFEKADAELIARVTVKGSYEMPCARCLGAIRQDQRVDEFELDFDIAPDTESVEYGDDVRQELLVALSTIIRCKEDCKGLCPKCGMDLNQGKCRCRKLKV